MHCAVPAVYFLVIIIFLSNGLHKYIMLLETQLKTYFVAIFLRRICF
jgi:hypothetical protein